MADISVTPDDLHAHAAAVGKLGANLRDSAAGARGAAADGAAGAGHAGAQAALGDFWSQAEAALLHAAGHLDLLSRGLHEAADGYVQTDSSSAAGLVEGDATP